MRKEVERPPVQIGLIALGCAKNLVDAEIMLGELLAHGMQITNDQAGADAVIVNTCSFIESAQQESVDAILESAAVREAHRRGQALIVAGCLPQRFREELPRLLPEVDAFMGIDQVTHVSEIVHQALQRRAARVGGPKTEDGERKSASTGANGQRARSVDAKSGSVVAALAEIETDKAQPMAPNSAPKENGQALFSVTQRPVYIPDYATPRFRLTPSHFAYLKIAEGCNHPCSFCIIPRMRGSHRSRQQRDIVAEARRLIAEGVRELNLISQDSTYYGLDLRPNHTRAIAAPERFTAAFRSLPAEGSSICTLLRELNALPGDFWIRLLYTHPAHWTDELMQTIAECEKVARYVDIPLQHIHQNMLERMRRETSREYIVDLLRHIRKKIPGITLRTTFIVGFPGETEEYFHSLIEFIRATRFERLGVFTYSREEGTRAGQMAGQVPEKIKRRRREQAMAEQREISRSVAASFVGRTLRVLVEKEASHKELQRASITSWEHGLLRGAEEHPARLKGHYRIARSHADAPDIDGRVYLRGAARLGEFARARIVGHTDYDLIAELE